jgi:hypothetical protein
MVAILLLLALFLCLGIGARRWEGRVHVLLIGGIVALLIVTLVSLYRL